VFWLALTVLLTATTALVLWPLLRASGRGAAQAAAGRQEADIRALYQDRLAELDAEQAAGLVTGDVRQALDEELAASLLREPGVADGAARDPGPRRVLAGVLGVLLPLLSLAAYLAIGEPRGDALRGVEAVFTLDPRSDRAALLDWQQRLEARVADRPEEAQSWYLLGQIDMRFGDYGAAAEAFATAHEAAGPGPNLDEAWLQARYLAAGGRLDATSRSIAARILERDPGQPVVLEMLAIEAFQSGDADAAVGYLNRALAGVDDPARQQALAAGLARVRAEQGDRPGTIDVAVEALAEPPAGATLFVIARPPGGGVPLAVVRRPATALPLSVRLDDAVSMSPSRKLSAATEVEVVARLSLSGQPRAGAGDWEWRSPTLTPADAEAPIRLQARLAPPDQDS